MNKLQKEKSKLARSIWKDLGIEKVSKKYGFAEVRRALNTWTRFQATNASLLKKKAALEESIREIEKRIG